ncbi:aldose 1-epimerase [Sphingomonas arenae]|uniref:aldose 1-epimerase n=1 Tax=Sphingomonas arenae TaxID=2812555 RepID=UPI0019674DB4|nr:aldose 1-epimerase [Sphingomonas arenae]
MQQKRGVQIMVSAEQLVLHAGSLELTLSPSIGGSIRDFHFVQGDGARLPITRPCIADAPGVLDMASFPLVPYVNRIRGGAFTFRGRDVRLSPNMPGDISPLHGQGWLAPWSVESAGDRDAILRFVHPAGEWPWSYEAVQHFQLDEGGLTVSLRCRNTSSEPMPCGLGQHPYFPCGPDTRLDTQVQTVWTIDEHVLPVEQIPASGRFDLRNRKVCGQGLDHGFGGWGGEARMSDPAWPADVVLSSPAARFFQLYSPESGGIFVAEPVSHANAALNAPEEDWSTLGIEVLEPGQQAELTMRLDVVPR